MARRSAGVKPVVEFFICLRCATAKAVTKAHGQADRTGLAIHHDSGPRLHLFPNSAIGPRHVECAAGRDILRRVASMHGNRWWLIVPMLATVWLGVVVLQRWPASDS